MAFPADPLDVTVELAIGADITAAPGTWSWTDVTTSIREQQKIVINRGRRNRIGNFPPTRVTATADNTNGNLCRHNPLSSYFGQLRKNTPMRVSVDNGAGPVVRAAAYVTGFPPSWDPSEADQVVTLNAVGITDRLARSKPLRSALYRSMAGVAPGDYVPHAYWPMEDESGATRFASGLAGGPTGSLAGGASLASADTPVGSLPLGTYDLNTKIYLPVPAYTNTGQWVFQWVVNIPSSPAADPQQIAEFRTPGGTVARWTVAVEDESPSADAIYVRGYNSSGTEVVTAATSVDHGDLDTSADFYGHTFMFTVASYQSGSDVAVWFEGIREDGLAMESALASVAGTHAGLGGTIKLTSPINDTVLGHATIYVDPNFSVIFGSSDADVNAEALDGFVGEMAHERAERLCREEGVPFTTAATTSQAMGPQGTGRLLDLLRECANADQGLLYEDLNFGLTYVSSDERYNLDPVITLAYDSGQILPPWDPTDDDQDYYNEVTASRPNGSSYLAADEDEIAAVGQFADQVNPNVATDAQLQHVAGWRLNLGLNDELTWPAVRPNLLLGGSLLDDWLASDLGQHMHITGHPSPLAPDTIRQIIEGYTETLGAYTYSVSANVSPASPWDVAVWDDDTLAKLDTTGSELHTAVNSSATSWDVATTSGPLWTTDNAEDGFDWYVGGERVTVTDVAASTITYGAVGTVSHGNNASVTPGLPASLAQGNLMVMVAAIRNSGAGVPDTPSGWTRWPVFQSTDNVQVFAKIAGASESGPTVTFTGGVANADTTAQIIRLAGKWHDAEFALLSKASCLNDSAQNITYPGLSKPKADDCLILYVGWKQDDWTSVASPGTEIAEPDTTTGDDQGIVWAYQIQTSRTAIPSNVFTVTGGASAISRGAVMAIRCDYQTATVTRSVNGVIKSHSAGAEVRLWTPMRWAL